MTPDQRLRQIIQAARLVERGLPYSRSVVTVLLKPWKDLHELSYTDERMRHLNLLQAAAARIELSME